MIWRESENEEVKTARWPDFGIPSILCMAMMTGCAQGSSLPANLFHHAEADYGVYVESSQLLPPLEQKPE